jgi:serine protease Do
MNRRLLVALVPSLLLLAGCVFAYRPPDDSPHAAAAPKGMPGFPEKLWVDAPPHELQSIPLATDIFTRLSAHADPAVVNIFSTTNVQTRVGDPLGLFTVRTPNLDFSAKALGTGFLISPDGFLLTNAHVVAEADEIKVFLWQESEVRVARLVGLDVASDLALLKIEYKQPLPFLTLADSDAAAVGEMAAAIGNPFGLEHSVTNGLISAKHRRIHEGRQGAFEDYLQTSAQINPGNSGGPLLNLYGEVVGVNTAVVQGGQGIGFAVPSNLVKEILPHLMRAGRVVSCYVGAEIVEAAPDEAARLQLPNRRGGEIKSVVAGGPAAQAGLRAGDVVVRVNGRQVYDSLALLRTLSLLIADRPATLTVLRNGRQQDVKITPVVAARDTTGGR